MKDQHEANIHRECEAYIDWMCARFNIRVPILVLDDTMYNPGACGEVGKFVIRIQRQFALTASQARREAVLRHELAHISVHNTLGDVEPHGSEFQRELARLGGDQITANTESVETVGETAHGPNILQVLGVIIVLFAALVILQGWILSVLPDSLAKYLAPVLAPVADFVWATYWQWPGWTIASGVVFVVAVMGMVGGVEGVINLLFGATLMGCLVAVILATQWTFGDGLSPWAASRASLIGIPMVAPENIGGFARAMVIVGSVVGWLLVVGIGTMVSLCVLSLFCRTTPQPDRPKVGAALVAKYWRGRRMD